MPRHSLLLIFLLALLFAIPFVLSDEEVSSDVVVLTKDNFQNVIDSSPFILIEFYAPWCGHCKALAPEYEKAATEMKGKVPIAKVDCTVEEDLCEQQGVTGFPTIKLFTAGQATPYEEGRTANDIVKYLEKESSPAITLLETKEAIEEFVENAKSAIVGFFRNDHDDRYKSFESLAKKLRHRISSVAHIGDSLHSEFGASDAPSVVLFRDFDDRKVVYSGDHGDALQEWINRRMVPLFGEINADNYKNYAYTDLPIAYVFLDPADEEDNKAVAQKIEELAHSAYDKVIATWIDVTKYPQQVQRLGLKGGVPSVAIEHFGQGIKYLFEHEGEEFMKDNLLSDWWNKFSSGELEPTVKSQPVPKDNSAPVTIVVAQNFKTIVDPSKDVLLEFYAPWCGHCKHLAPIYDQLGEHFKDIDSVVIAKMDATENDVDKRFNVKGFPTIVFIPAGETDFIVYQGDRSLSSLINFIEKHRKTEFEFPQYVEEEDDDDDDEEEGDDEHAGHDHSHDEL